MTIFGVLSLADQGIYFIYKNIIFYRFVNKAIYETFLLNVMETLFLCCWTASDHEEK